MSSELSDPPGRLQPNAVSWPAGKEIVRVHNSRFAPAEFNPGFGNGRFHPLVDGAGQAVPTLYGSNTIDGALSESVFHDVPLTGPDKRVMQSALRPLVVSVLAPARMLTLLELKGHGLRKIGVARRQLVDTNADQYTRTRKWGTALYDSAPDADGLIWVSRQHDTSEAIVLFGSRVAAADLDVIAGSRGLCPPGAAWHELLRAAEAAGITIVFP